MSAPNAGHAVPWVAVTLFDASGKNQVPVDVSWERFCQFVANPTPIRPTKSEVPLLKAARFGTRRTSEGSLCHADNVQAITGIEAAYNGGELSIEAAAGLVEAAGVDAVVYSALNYMQEHPCWRVVCRLTREYPPFKRRELVGKLNRIFDGRLVSNSFVLTQPVYLGRMRQRDDGSPAQYESARARGGQGLDEIEIDARYPVNGEDTNGQAANAPSVNRPAFNANTRDRNTNADANHETNTSAAPALPAPATHANVPSKNEHTADASTNANAIAHVDLDTNGNAPTPVSPHEPNTSAPDALPRFGEIAEALMANGYVPVPLFAQHPDPGRLKTPCVVGWNAPDYQPKIDDWTRDKATGLRCRETGAIDIDITNEKLCEAVAAEVCRVLGVHGSLLFRVGRAPKLLIPLRWDGNALKKTKLDITAPDGTHHIVEILGDGQQFAAYQLHPGTGKPYEWRDGRGPLQVPLSALPGVDGALRGQLVQAVTTVLEGLGCTVRVTGDTSRIHDGSNGNVALAANAALAVRSDKQCDEATGAAAMEFIIAHSQGKVRSDDYETWFRDLKALKAASLGWPEPGRELCHRYSALSPKYDHAESDAKWDAITVTDDPHELGAGTLIKLAQDLGWVQPAYRQVQQGEALEWSAPQSLVIEEELAPYPVERLPNGIREAVIEVVGFVQCPPGLGACSALSALSIAAQALANVQRTSQLHGPIGLYLLSTADSGERKSAATNTSPQSIPRLGEGAGATNEDRRRPCQGRHLAMGGTADSDSEYVSA